MFLVRKILILLFLIVTVASCNRHRNSASSERIELGAAEYDVLTAWIDGTLTANKREKRPDQIVIYDNTDSDDNRFLRDDNGQPVSWEKFAESLREKAPSLRQATLDAYRKANANPALLRPRLHPLIRYQVVSMAQLEPILGKGGSWYAYYKQFPSSQGLLTFSRVGFSPDGTQAFFYYSNICEGLCGGGSYVVMQRQATVWVIDREIEMWVS